MKRRRTLVIVAALAVFAGACGTFTFVTRDDGTAAAEDDNPMMVVAPSTSAPLATTAATASTTTSIVLPVPEPPPADPYAPTPIVQLGSIHIPSIGLQHAVFEGVTLTIINEGPGHWPGSAMPGQVGNTVFPGHRTTYSRPFHDLDKLVPGDDVVFQMPEADYVYKVVETKIVTPEELWVIDQGVTPTFTLIACHPKGSARQRIVVKGDLAATIPKVVPTTAVPAGFPA